MTTLDEGVAFLKARRDTDRGARERWIRAEGFDRADAAAVESAKAKWHARPLLADPALKSLSLCALAAARGRIIGEAEPFYFTVWRGKFGVTGGQGCTCTVEQFVGWLREVAEHVAAKGEGWVACPTSNSDGHRTNASTTAMHALNFDCDGRGTWDRLLAVLNHFGVAYIVYQSGGWTPDKPKWHVLICLSQPFDVSTPEKIEQWKYAYNHARVVFGAVAELMGEGFDPACETPAQPVFITERRNAHDPSRQVVWRSGHTIDLAALVAALPEVPREIRAESSSAATGAPNLVERRALDDDRLEQVIAALCVPMSKILSGRRDLYLALPGALLDRELAPDDVLAIVEEVSGGCPGDPSYTSHEVESKHREHVHCTRTTIGKFERGEHYTRIGTIVERWPEVADAIDQVLPREDESFVRAMFEEHEARKAAGSPPVATTATRDPILLPPISAADVRKKMGALRRKLLKSTEREKLIDGVILGALLDGEALPPLINGAPIVDDKGRAIDRDEALRRCMRVLGWHLLNITWHQVIESGLYYKLSRNRFGPDEIERSRVFYDQERQRRLTWRVRKSAEKIAAAEQARLERLR